MGLYYPRCAAVLSVVFDGFASSGESDSRPTVVYLDGSPDQGPAPRRASVHLNSYAKADTFELEVLAKALPVSPELIRAIQVEIYVFQTDGLEKDIGKYATEENLVLAGLADEGEIDAESVRITGRDYTALMLDKAWPPTKAIPVGRPIDQVIQDLVDEASQARVTGRILKVEYRAPVAQALATGAAGVSGAAATSSGDKKAGVNRKQKSSPKKKPSAGEQSTKTNKKGLPQKGGSYWDVIQKLALRHGLICYVHGTTVVLDQPRGLTERTNGEAPQLVYGKNLQGIQATRKFARAALPQFTAYGYDDKERRQVQGKWPPDAPKRPSGLGATLDTTEILTAPPGIHGKDALTEYCKSYYEARSRAEGKVHFRTRSLRDTEQRDLLQTLRPGHPVRLEWDHVQGSGELRRMNTEQRYGRLLELGYSREVAQAVANGYERLEQVNDRALYLREVSFDWSKDGGITIEGDAVNYVVEVRDDA